MDDTYIKQHDIAQKYIQGELTPEESTEFEVYLMDKPELVEELELDTLFKNHILLLEEKRKKPDGFLSWFSASPLKYVMASSVTFVLGVLVSSQMFFVDTNSSYRDVFKFRNTNVVYLSAYRNLNKNAQDSVDASGLNILVLGLQVDKGNSKDYLITIIQDNQNILTSTKFKANEDGDIYVPIPVEELQSGELEVFYKRANTAGANYSLKIEIIK